MINTARINIQGHITDSCSQVISMHLNGIENILNVRVIKEESVVIFSFDRLHKLSDALNLLTSIGFPEVGDNYPLQASA
ncbi:MAG: hypothetical protein WBG46_08380 [Nonlabens sp.]